MGARAELPEEYGTTFLLPIDWTTDKHRDLSVKIPKGYKSLQPASTWDKAPLIEFIPHGEKQTGWSEMITIQKLTGRDLSADRFVNLLIQQISNQVKTTLLFRENAKDKYQTVVFALKYTHNGNEEILGGKYLSGPHDCQGIQYTIRLRGKESQEKAVSKIRDFFDQNLRVIEKP